MAFLFFLQLAGAYVRIDESTPSRNGGSVHHGPHRATLKVRVRRGCFPKALHARSNLKKDSYMLELLGNIVVAVIAGYAGIGVVFGLFLMFKGYGTRNPLLALVGAAIGWPWLIQAYRNGEPPFDK
jgi:hypothetical protein